MIVLDTGRRRQVSHLAFSPDSRWLAILGDYLSVYDIGSAHEVATQDFLFGVIGGAWVGDGNTFAVQSGTQGLLLLDIPTGEVVIRGLKFRGWVSCGFAPNRRHFVGFDPTTQMLTGCRLTGRSVARVWEKSIPDGWKCHNLVYFSAGDRFAALEIGNFPTSPRRVLVRSAVDGEVVSDGPIPTESRYLCDLQVSPDGTLFAAWQATAATAFLWPADTSAGPPLRLRRASGKHFTGLAFHPSGRLLAATSNDATVTLYAVPDGGVAGTFDWNIGRLPSVAFSPDGCLAAAGSDKGRVVVWDADL